MSRTSIAGILAMVACWIGCSATTEVDRTQDVLVVAAAEPSLAALLRPSADGFTREDSLWVSAGYRNASHGNVDALGVALGARANGSHTVGLSRFARDTFRLQLANAADVEGSTDRGRVLYRDVFSDTDLLAAATAHELELAMVLRTERAPTTYRWKLALPETLRASALDGGLVVERTDGSRVATFARAFALDAKGTRRDARMEYADGELRIDVDTRGLTFPVVLDPTVASAVWSPIALPAMPSGVFGAVYNPVSQRVTAVGTGTWEWDGTSWTTKASNNGFGSTPAGTSGALAYDAARGKIVLFGGGRCRMVYDPYKCCGQSSCRECDFDDSTWTFDGATWKKEAPANTPGPRYGHALAYDASTSQVIAYGGTQCSFACNETHCLSTADMADTWAWNGTNWSSVTTATSPGGSTGARMVYDSGRSRLVLTNAGFSGTTYEFYGADWHSAAAGPGFGWSGLTYDSARSRTVLLGGIVSPDALNPSYLSDTHEYNGSSWSKVVTGGPLRGDVPLAFDAKRSVSVAVAPSGEFVLERSASSWTRKYAAGAPPALGSYGAPSGIVADPQRKRIVLFGYESFSASDASGIPQTWEWNGSAWEQKNPVHAPPPRELFSMAYAGNGMVLLYGGSAYVNSTETAYADTWLWNGTDWEQAVGGLVPPGALSPTLAYDAANDAVVMFGGKTPYPTTYKAETHVFKNGQWTKKTPTSAPSAREGAAAAFMPTRNQVVLFGGYSTCLNPPTCSTYGNANDTWAWDGSNWTRLSPPSPPAALGSPSVAWNAARARMVLFGLENYSTPSTWEFDGTSWFPISVSSLPFDGRKVVYEEQGSRVLLYGPRALYQYLRPGGSCSTAGDCFTGKCVDGVCCDATCGTCEQCNTPAALGSCAPVSGRADPDTCTGAQTCNLQGQCKLTLGQACTGAADCASNHCVDGVCCGTASCGTCETCALAGSPGVCAVVTNAADPDSCTGAQSCSNVGQCKLADGQDCAGATQCASNNCVSGKCCTGTTCRFENGGACTAGIQCKSGFCVDGVCCNVACSNSCEACNLTDSVGTCKVVAKDAVPGGKHPACKGDPSVCGGGCDGVNPSCAYKPSLTTCGESRCSGPLFIASQCDGNGACRAAEPQDCRDYACTPQGCKPTCKSNADCAPGSVCDTSKGQCASASARCSDDVTILSSDGNTYSCAPYRCQDGRCSAPCATSAQCASGNSCVGGVCIRGGAPTSEVDAGTPAANAAPQSHGGGCAVGTSAGGDARTGIMVGVLAWAARRRRSRTSKESAR